jgi:hypothetical protein
MPATHHAPPAAHLIVLHSGAVPATLPQNCHIMDMRHSRHSLPAKAQCKLEEFPGLWLKEPPRVDCHFLAPATFLRDDEGR